MHEELSLVPRTHPNKLDMVAHLVIYIYGGRQMTLEPASLAYSSSSRLMTGLSQKQSKWLLSNDTWSWPLAFTYVYTHMQTYTSCHTNTCVHACTYKFYFLHLCMGLSNGVYMIIGSLVEISSFLPSCGFQELKLTLSDLLVTPLSLSHLLSSSSFL